MTESNAELAKAPEQVLEIAQTIIQGAEFGATFRGLGEAFAEQLALAAQRGYQAGLTLRTPSDGVKFKPLKWVRQKPDDSLQRAYSIVGVYRVWTYAGAGGWFWQLEGERQHTVYAVDDAIAAAQADYEQRILSALSPGKE